MQKVLIADGSEEFLHALTEALRGIYHVKSCRSGNDALELIMNFNPDILILDLMLPGMDGLSLLQYIETLGKQMHILATTRFLSNYVVEAVARLGVGYLMMKPCDVQAVVSRIADIAGSQEVPLVTEPAPRTAVSNMLLALNIATKRRGYNCLREAVLLMAEKPGQSITKELYPAVGALCGASRDQVERVIRTAIDAAWQQRDETIWRLYFPPKADGAIHRPSNATFICRLADCLAQEQSASSL